MSRPARSRPRPRTSRARPAVAAVWALVVLAVLGTALSLIAVQFLANRRTAEGRERQVQADWLARAGVEHAAAGLLGGEAGPREQTLAPLPGWHVHVWVEADREKPGVFTVTSEARAPADGGGVVRSVRREFRRVEEKGRVRLDARGGAAPGPVREGLPAPAPAPG